MPKLKKKNTSRRLINIVEIINGQLIKNKVVKFIQTLFDGVKTSNVVKLFNGNLKTKKIYKSKLKACKKTNF